MIRAEDLKMDGETVLNEEQLSRCRRIWTTDIGRCPRQTEHRILNVTPRLQKHFLSHQGTIIHREIENIVKGTSDPTGLDDIAEYKPKLLDTLKPIRKNLEYWLETASIDLIGAESEVKFEMPLPLGYTLVRTIDLLTPEYIIDFKSGEKANRKDYRHDLLISTQMVRNAGEGDRKMMIVFLGGEKPEELELYGKRMRVDRAADEGEVETLLQKTVAEREMIRTGVRVPCEFGISCAMCEWRHVCNGV
jgi:hypothetical protein